MRNVRSPPSSSPGYTNNAPPNPFPLLALFAPTTTIKAREKVERIQLIHANASALVSFPQLGKLFESHTPLLREAVMAAAPASLEKTGG